MRPLLSASVGLVVAGVPGAAIALGFEGMLRVRRRMRRHQPALRPILIVLLVELRSGRSALAALQTVASMFPDHPDLALGARVATISGLTQAALAAKGEMKGLLSQLARAQRSGAALGDTVRAMIEEDIKSEKARRVGRTRSLPVRLMIPVTLLILPGLVLVFYAPSLLRLFEELSGPLT